MTEIPDVTPDLRDEVDDEIDDEIEVTEVHAEVDDGDDGDAEDAEDAEDASSDSDGAAEDRDDETAAYGDGALFAVAPAGGIAALATLPEPEVTGDARVDAATARLGELVDLPASEHVGVYDDVHRRLQDALADAEVT